MSTFADTSPKGIPVGENNMGEATPKTYPFRYEDNCYNVNKLIVAAMKEEKQGPITYRQAWDESVVCDEIMKEEKLITSQNAETWFKECESYLGIICEQRFAFFVWPSWKWKRVFGPGKNYDCGGDNSWKTFGEVGHVYMLNEFWIMYSLFGTYMYNTMYV